MAARITPTADAGSEPVRSAEGAGALPLQLDRDAMGETLRRLKRAQGQIGGIIRMIEDGRDCTDIVTQMAAVSKALDRVGFAIIANSLKQCLTQDPGDENMDTSSLEKLFLSLA